MVRVWTAAALALWAQAGAAQDARAALIEAVRSTGCRMTEDQAEAILPGLGLDQAAVGEAAEAMVAAGEAALEGEPGDQALVLSDALCAGAVRAPAAPLLSRKSVIQAVRARGCALAEADSQSAFGAVGLPAEEAEDLSIALLGDGAASLVAGIGGGLHLLLSPEYCGGAGRGPAFEAARAGREAADALVGLLREAGCSLPVLTPTPQMTARGLDAAALGAARDTLVFSEEAEYDFATGVMTLTRNCGAP